MMGKATWKWSADGIQKRGAKAPRGRGYTADKHDQSNPLEETPSAWRAVPAWQQDDDFLFPENDPEDPCPISKTTNKHSKEDNDNYMAWIR